MNDDERHLSLLSIFHYVVGGLAALIALFPVIHLVVGLMVILAPEAFESEGGPPLPPLFGWFFVIIPSVFITAGWIFAGFVIAAGRSLARRKRYTFCLVMAGIECMFLPFGTVLGVFTIVVLTRPSVRAMFSTSGAIEGVPQSSDA